jgi:hypothetical protein
MRKSSIAPSPHVTLLIASARVEMQADDRAAVSMAIQKGVDWNVALSLAHQHGLIPLLARHVASGAIDPTTIPAQAATALHHQATTTIHRNLYLTGELVTLLRDFAVHDIRTVPLKGPVLAHTLYKSVALRRFNDLDLLVHELDLQRVIALLVSRGYHAKEAYQPTLSPLMRSTQHHISMIAPSGRYRVEVHYHLLPPLGRTRYGLHMIEADLDVTMFLGIQVRVLCAEALLVYLCMHGTGHLWERLEWICGVAELLRSGRVQDWNRVHAYADRFAATRRVHTGLLIAHQLLGAPIPQDIGRADKRTQDATYSIINRIMHDPGYMYGYIHNPIGTLAYQMLTDPGPMTWVRRCAITVFTPHMADITTITLPRLLWPLYYLIRPIRLSLRHGSRLVHRMRNMAKRRAESRADLTTLGQHTT